MGGEVFRRLPSLKTVSGMGKYSARLLAEKGGEGEIWKGGDRHAGRWPSWTALTVLGQGPIMLLYDNLQMNVWGQVRYFSLKIFVESQREVAAIRTRIPNASPLTIHEFRSFILSPPPPLPSAIKSAYLK